MFGIGGGGGGMGMPTNPYGAILSGVGGIFSSFGSRKMKPVYYDKELKQNYAPLRAGLQSDVALGNRGLGQFETATGERIKKTGEFAKQAEFDFNSLLAKSRQNNPFQQEAQLRQSRLGDLSRFADDLAEQGRRRQMASLAALGYHGGGGGSFSDASNINRISTNLAPQFGSIMAGITPSISALNAVQNQDLMNQLGLIDRRTGTADYGAGLELLPAYEANALRQGQISNLDALTSAIRNNVFGMQKQQNWADQVGGAFQGAGQALGGGPGGATANPGITQIAGGGYGGYGGGAPNWYNMGMGAMGLGQGAMGLFNSYMGNRGSQTYGTGGPGMAGQSAYDWWKGGGGGGEGVGAYGGGSSWG